MFYVSLDTKQICVLGEENSPPGSECGQGIQTGSDRTSAVSLCTLERTYAEQVKQVEKRFASMIELLIQHEMTLATHLTSIM